jgi:hypothetical protein
MGKGGGEAVGTAGDGKEVNLAAWLVSVNTLKIQPFELPPLGTGLFSALFLFAIFLFVFVLFRNSGFCLQ